MNTTGLGPISFPVFVIGQQLQALVAWVKSAGGCVGFESVAGVAAGPAVVQQATGIARQALTKDGMAASGQRLTKSPAGFVPAGQYAGLLWHGSTIIKSFGFVANHKRLRTKSTFKTKFLSCGAA